MEIPERHVHESRPQTNNNKTSLQESISDELLDYCEATPIENLKDDEISNHLEFDLNSFRNKEFLLEIEYRNLKKMYGEEVAYKKLKKAKDHINYIIDGLKIQREASVDTLDIFNQILAFTGVHSDSNALLIDLNSYIFNTPK